MKNGELKKIMLEKYGAFCESCVYPHDKTTPIDLHHCIIGDRKKWHDILTVEENCVLVCRDCHPYTNGHKFRVEVLGRKVKSQGWDAMADWFDSLPEKLQMTNEWIWIELERIKLEELK
jgi:hypothetical protein